MAAIAVPFFTPRAPVHRNLPVRSQPVPSYTFFPWLMTETQTLPTPPIPPARRGRRRRAVVAAIGTVGITGAAAFGIFQAAQPVSVALVNGVNP